MKEEEIKSMIIYWKKNPNKYISSAYKELCKRQVNNWEDKLKELKESERE